VLPSETFYALTILIYRNESEELGVKFWFIRYSSEIG